MMTNQIILKLNDENANLELVGGKGASLAKLMDAWLPVPEGFHITTHAYRRFVVENDLTALIQSVPGKIDPEKPSTLEDAAREIHQAFMSAAIPEDVASAIVGAYGDLSGRDPAVAVRSSATAEDLPEASFAGQQESFLNVSGADRVLEATRQCWSSLWTARAIAYRRRQGIKTEGIALAVVVQELVPAEVAGILFTANPRDGNRDQVQISASWGLGDAVVGGRVTPDDYTVDKETMTVVRREVAGKEIMTVRVDGATEDQPVPENLRDVPVLENADLEELTRLGIQIEELFGKPMDVEWALADGVFSILQARPITGLPEIYVPRPEAWELPDPKGRYMRASIIDLMPDPLSPLFATMGVPIYNESILQMMVDITGSRKENLPADVIHTIQDYAYMRVNFSAREWWAMVVKMGPKLINLIRSGPDHFRHVALPEYETKVDELESRTVAVLSAQELWNDAHALTAAAMDHLSILQVDTLGAAAGSEGLFTAIYERLYQKEEDPPARAFVMGYDSTPVRSEKSLYDLAQWARVHADLSEFLLKSETGEISKSIGPHDVPAEVSADVWRKWLDGLQAHLEKFGHLLYDLDFEQPVPREDPTPELETMKMYMRGDGADPHERQERLEARRLAATEQLLERARGIRGWAVRKALGWAQSVGEVREDSIASIGLAYPRLRENLKEIGRRIASSGGIDHANDIFWLTAEEVEAQMASVEAGESLEPMTKVIEERRKRRQAEMKIMPPTQLPPSDTYMGIPIGVFVPGEGGAEAGRLKGVGASSGSVTGTAYVLHGPEDFDQMKPGGILVAKLTTPAWTPLFAMAGGVVTDIGGPLSHGSIVAREYGIPAVLGTGAATRLIESGQQITVDGDSGYVLLPEDGSD